MARISRRRIQQFLTRSREATTTTEKGRALEDLICYLFETIPGISIGARNVLNPFETDELDIGLWNEKSETRLFSLPDVIPIECKNWDSSVGSAEVDRFIGKLRRRGLRFGILIATNGITGNTEDKDAAHAIIMAGLMEITPMRIIVITLEELSALEDSDQLLEMMKRKISELQIYGTVFP